MAQNQNLSRMYQMEQSVLENIRTYFPDVQITHNDLKSPTPEAVSKFYGAFLEELGANIANLLQIQNNQMTLIDHVDMYNVSVPMLNQYQCINFFLKGIGVDTFSVSDLVVPTYKRTLCFFDALLKFLAYCDECIASLQPELERIRDLGVRRKEFLSKIEVLRTDINHRASARGQRQDKIKELNKAIGSEKEKLDMLMNEKEGQVSAQNSIKKLLEEDAEKENQLIRSIKKIEDDVMELKGMIVKSPQKLKQLVNEQIQKKEELLQSVKNFKHQIEEKKRLTQTISEQQIKQEERFQKVKDIFDLKLNIKNKEQEKIDALDQYSKIVESCNENELRISNQEERRKMISENVEEYKQRKEKLETDEKSLVHSAKKELEILINRREEKMKHVDTVQMGINLLYEDIRQIEMQLLEYKKSEQITRSTLKSMEQKLTIKYENIILRLKSISENLQRK